MTKLCSHAFASSLARQVARFFAASANSAEAATAGAASPVPKQQTLRAAAATSHWNELWESPSACSGGSVRSFHGRVNAPPPPLAPASQQQRQQPSITRISATSSLTTTRGVASDAAAQKTASGVAAARAPPPTKEWHLVPLGYRPAHAVPLQERIEEMWESRVGRGEERHVGREGVERKKSGEGAEEKGKEEERRELEALNWAFSQLPVSVFPCPHKASQLPPELYLAFLSFPCQSLHFPSLSVPPLPSPPALLPPVLEIPSDARLSDALRMLQHAGLTAAPVRDVGVGDDAPLQQRYLGMVDGAGIVLWVMGQVRRDVGDAWVGSIRSSIEVPMAAAAGGGLTGLVGLAGLAVARLGRATPLLDRSSIEVKMAAGKGGAGRAGLERSSIEVKMAAAAGGGLAGLAFGGLGAAALGAPDVATLAAMWAGSMAGGLLGATSAEAPGEGEAGGGVERLRVSAGGLDRLLQGNMFQTAKVSVKGGGWGQGSEGEVGNGGAWGRGGASVGPCWFIPLALLPAPLSLCRTLWVRSADAPSDSTTHSPLFFFSYGFPSLDAFPQLSDLVGSFRWRSFLPLASSDSVLSLMLLLAMPHRPQVLPIVTYPPTSSAPFSSSPSSASPTSSPEPAAAASSAGSGSALVPSLSALVSQADVVNFLAECDGQPWFEWVAGRSLKDMGLPRMGAESTVKVEESDPVMEPFRLMLQHDIGGVPVVAPGTNRITANVSARDVLQLLTSPHLAEQHHIKPLTVAELVHDAQRPHHGAADVIWPIMVPPVTCRLSTPLREVIHAFRVARVHRIYVTREPEEGVEGGELVGVVTLRDAIGRFLVRQEEGETRGEKVEEPVPASTEVGSDGLSL
ncbi:unnamed protein product [Closterium sp. NIES-65]|nr:unnamed protein product [Closterium sp. NIES-65]